MGYTEYLKDLLRPLRLYELDSGPGAAELLGIGEELDRIYSELEAAERETLLATAEDEGLAAYEAILPFTPAYENTAGRRRALEALLRIDQCAFTLPALNDTAAGCGLRVRIEEAETAQTVRVSFPYNRGVPNNIQALQARIGEILPCHLGVEYVYLYLLWEELEAWFAQWAALEAAVASWDELEKYVREEEEA